MPPAVIYMHVWGWKQFNRWISKTNQTGGSENDKVAITTN